MTYPYQNLFVAASDRFGLPRHLNAAVAQQESGFDPNAYGNASEIGLMQIYPPAHPECNIDRLWEPEYNIECGTQYLTFCYSEFPGDIDKAIAAYRQGVTGVRQYGITNWAYVQNIKTTWAYFKTLYPNGEMIPLPTKINWLPFLGLTAIVVWTNSNRH